MCHFDPVSPIQREEDVVQERGRRENPAKRSSTAYDRVMLRKREGVRRTVLDVTDIMLAIEHYAVNRVAGIPRNVSGRFGGVTGTGD